MCMAPAARNHGILIKWVQPKPQRYQKVGEFIHIRLASWEKVQKPIKSHASENAFLYYIGHNHPWAMFESDVFKHPRWLKWLFRDHPISGSQKKPPMSSSVDPGRSCGFTFFCIVVVSGQLNPILHPKIPSINIW